MPIKITLNEEELTNIRSLNISLEIAGGATRREPRALQFTVTRVVGNAPDAAADQLTFGTIKGDSDNAAIVPKAAAVVVTDDNRNALVGEWTLKKCFIESYSVTDIGPEILETTRLRANDVTYKRDDGMTTEALKV
jgi:hypothetical protein